MPSKLRKAIGAVKDQTSISIAKVSNNTSSNLDVAVLKATTHDEVPVDERYITEILLLTCTNKSHASAATYAISKRIGRTRNWVVAIKTLVLILRIFQDGDSHFPDELNATKRGAKILNLSNFRNDTNSSPWDYAYFVRTFALYLDERLQCLLKGKISKNRRPVNELTLETLLDRITCWQRLLDRVVATEPTGAAKSNRLVQTCLYTVVKESFDLYKDVSDGLTLLLDSFYQLDYQYCVDAYQICIKAAKQFEELSSFYNLCKSIEVGRISEYPSVQSISEELIESLQEFLRDQSSLQTCSNGGTRNLQAPQLLLPPAASLSDVEERKQEPLSPFNPRETSETSEVSSSFSSQGRTSSSTAYNESGRTSFSSQQLQILPGDDNLSSFNPREVSDEQNGRISQEGTTPSTISIDQEGSSSDDLTNVNKELAIMGNGFLDELPQKDQEKQEVGSVEEEARTGWELELELAKAAGDISLSDVNQNDNATSFYMDPVSVHDQNHQQPNYVNPFLHCGNEALSPAVTPRPEFDNSTDDLSFYPTFQATPTFSVRNPDVTTSSSQIENDPFAPVDPMAEVTCTASSDQQQLFQEQQLWLQQQDKIIARHIS